jgi:hypothetical protein
MATPAPPKAYRYTAEIGQMCFVFNGECSGLNGETKDIDDEVVQYIEDIVRSQVSEIVRAPVGQRERRSLTRLQDRWLKLADKLPDVALAISPSKISSFSSATTAQRSIGCEPT